MDFIHQRPPVFGSFCSFSVLSVIASLCSHIRKFLILSNSGLDHACRPRALAQKNSKIAKSYKSMGFVIYY